MGSNGKKVLFSAVRMILQNLPIDGNIDINEGFFGVCSIKTIPTSCHEAFEEAGKYEILNPECPVGLFCMRHRLENSGVCIK